MNATKQNHRLLSAAPIASQTILTEESSEDDEVETQVLSPEISKNFTQLMKINGQLLNQLQSTLPLVEQFKHQSEQFCKHINNDSYITQNLGTNHNTSDFSSKNRNQHVDINERLFQAETILDMILKMDSKTSDLLIDQLELPILTQFKNYLQQLKQNEDNNNNYNSEIQFGAPQEIATPAPIQSFATPIAVILAI